VTQRHRVLATMIAVSAVVYMERTAVSVTAPDIIRDLGISETQMGSIFSAFYVAYAAFMTPGGALLDRYGSRRVLGASGLAAALFTALTAVCGLRVVVTLGAAFACLAAVRLCSGLCVAPVYPACAKLICSWFPPSLTARVQALVFSTTLLAMAVVPLVLVPIIRDFGWKSVFYVLAGGLAAAFTFWCVSVRDQPLPTEAACKSLHPATGVPALSVLLSRNVLLLAASYGAFTYFVVLLESWSFYYYREVRHFSAAESAAYVAAMMVTAAAGTLLGGWTSDQMTTRFGAAFGRRAVPIAGLVLSVGFCAIGVAGLSPLITATAIALSYGSLSFCDAVYWIFAAETTAEHSGKACGLMNTGGNGGSIIAPVATPLIAAKFGWDIALVAGAIIALSAVLPWVFIQAVSVQQSRIGIRPLPATAD
jgi:MFS transporter, ACS family, glucarate transporter